MAESERPGTDQQASAPPSATEGELIALVEPDPPDLRFDPFAVGRGLEPVGFVHALRVASYAASQRARGATSPLAHHRVLGRSV